MSSSIDVEIVRNKLKDFTIDEIIQHLRRAITEDIKVLENHVTYVHVRFCFCLIAGFFRRICFSKN